MNVFVSFCCMIGALRAKCPIYVLLLLLAKGCLSLFVVVFFWNRDKGGGGGIWRILYDPGIGGSCSSCWIQSG